MTKKEIAALRVLLDTFISDRKKALLDERFFLESISSSLPAPSEAYDAKVDSAIIDKLQKLYGL